MSDENRAGLRRDFFEALAQPLRVQICTGEPGPGSLLPSESVFEMSRRVYVIMVPDSFTVDQCQDAPVEAGPAVPGTRRI